MILKTSFIIKWRESLVPVVAVIPALHVYVKIVVVKKLVALIVY